jgi:hypothetical protein
MNNLNTFENYLRQQHIKECPFVLDDGLEDDFERWLDSKDVDDIIEYAEEALKNV